MTDIQIILTILASGFMLWQMVYIALGVSYATKGRRVKIGLGPGLVSIVLAIVVVLL